MKYSKTLKVLQSINQNKILLYLVFFQNFGLTMIPLLDYIFSLKVSKIFVAKKFFLNGKHKKLAKPKKTLIKITKKAVITHKSLKY